MGVGGGGVDTQHMGMKSFVYLIRRQANGSPSALLILKCFYKIRCCISMAAAADLQILMSLAF